MIGTNRQIMDAQPLRHVLRVAAGLLLASAGFAGDLRLDNAAVAIDFTTRSQVVHVTSTEATPFTIQSPVYLNTGIVPWLTVTADNNQTTPAALTIAFTRVPLDAGPYEARVTLAPTTSGAPVTLVVVFNPVTPGPTGVIVTPTALSVSVPHGGSARNKLSLQNATGGAISPSFTVVTADGANWLSASAAPLTIQNSQYGFVTVVTDGSSLPDGTYFGTIAVTPATGQPIPVSFTVGGSGPSVNSSIAGITYSNGVSSTEQVTVSGAASYSATAGTDNGINWLVLTAGGQSGVQVTNVSTNQPLSFSATSAAASLDAGVYTGTIAISTDNTNLSVSVTLLVSGAPSTIITANPQSLTFAYQTGVSTGRFPWQTIAVTGPAGGMFGAASDSAWLVPESDHGDIPGNLAVYAVIPQGGLAPATYNGTLTITVGAGSRKIPVQLLVTDKPVLWGSLPSPQGGGTALFTTSDAKVLPDSQDVFLFATDDSTPSFSITSVPNWLTASSSGNKLTIHPNVTGSGSAVYADVVQITADAYANSPVGVPVVLVVNGGSNLGPLTLSPASLDFFGSVGGPPIATQLLTVSSSNPASFTISASSWLHISFSGDQITNKTLTIAADPTAVGVGTTYGQITLVANGVTQTVPVSITLTGTGGEIQVDPASLGFTARVAGAAPPAQTVTVSNKNAGSAAIHYSITSFAPWLKTDASTKATKSDVSISVDPSGMLPGVYQGQVTMTPEANGSPVKVDVTFTIELGPVISASSGTLAFVYRSGGDSPGPQSVTVSGGDFDVAASSDGGWLKVSPASGTAGGNITVSILNASSLSVGSHTGTIVVQGANGAAGVSNITVTLSVIGHLPTVSAVANAASGLAGAIAPGEVISLVGTDFGPEMPVAAQPDESGKVATKLGEVQVLVNGFPAPILSVQANKVTAVVPFEISRFTSAFVSLQYLGQSSNGLTVPVALAAPAIYTQDGSGFGAAGYNADFTPNGPSNPIAKGGVIILFMTGAGQTAPAGTTGHINPVGTTDLPVPEQPVTVLVDGLPAAHQFLGGAPGSVEGIVQINVTVPSGARSGPVPVAVKVGGEISPAGVTISVK
jgi:uncharacterized protein (TIGR03437 family)